MSFKPISITQGPFFYPAGNTPAVCITQSLPPDIDAALLLLGCGDIRNILFTAYTGAGLGNCKLDFTCCDIESEIVARNVLALTLILDDTEGRHTRQLWNIFHHVFLNADAFAYLRTHVGQLLPYAQSNREWNNGPYGSIIRFYDETTLANVLQLWKLYGLSPEAPGYNQSQANLRYSWLSAQQVKNLTIGQGLHIYGICASAPVIEDAIGDLSRSFHTCWRNGTTFEDEEHGQDLEFANPMFVCLRSALRLRYGTDPLLGSHLAAACDGSIESPPKKAALTAIHQLGAWAAAFRKASLNIKIRYMQSDAIAFCNALRYHQTSGEDGSLHGYRSNWDYFPLLPDPEHHPDEEAGPTTFDVIDTSNLADHLGILNLLSPLHVAF